MLNCRPRLAAIPPPATVTVPLVELNKAVRDGSHVPTVEPSDQVLPRADHVPEPPAAALAAR